MLSVPVFVGNPLGRFIETAGIRVLRGRGFTDADRAGTPAVAVVSDMDPRLPIPRLGTAESWRDREIGPMRWIASGVGAMGLLALGLAGAGLYAVMTYLVARRRHEMAVRLALGATPLQLTALVIGDGLRLSIPGLIVGAMLSVLVAYLARVMLLGVSPFDPVAFGSVAAILLVVALVATLVPALRASKLDPLVTLRRQ